MPPRKCCKKRETQSCISDYLTKLLQRKFMQNLLFNLPFSQPEISYCSKDLRKNIQFDLNFDFDPNIDHS